MIQKLRLWEPYFAIGRGFIFLLAIFVGQVMVKRVVCLVLNSAKDVIVLSEIYLNRRWVLSI